MTVGSEGGLGVDINRRGAGPEEDGSRVNIPTASEFYNPTRAVRFSADVIEFAMTGTIVLKDLAVAGSRIAAEAVSRKVSGFLDDLEATEASIELELEERWTGR